MSNFTVDGWIDISEGGAADQWTDWMEANSISWTTWSFCKKGESSAARKQGHSVYRAIVAGFKCFDILKL